MARIELKFDRIRLDLRQFSDRAIEPIAIQEIENTIARTNDAVSKGQDADGKAFRAYSPRYVDAIRRAFTRTESAREGGKSLRGFSKQARYLRKKGGHTSPPNLRVSNTLLGSRRAFRIAGGAEGRFIPGRPNVAGSKKSPTNVQLANYLAKLGFKDWHAFGKADIERIKARVELFAREAGAKMIQVTKGS